MPRRRHGLSSSLFFLLPFIMSSMLGCAGKTDTQDNVLRVLNCEDYIYIQEEDGPPDLMDQWVGYMKDTYGQDVSYIYDTFDTNETMFNELKTGKVQYDVVIPSDYMIQKMMRLDMLEPFQRSVYETDDVFGKETNNIKSYISPYLKGIFEGIKAKKEGTDEESSLLKYAVPYMWGTLGLIYNPKAKMYESRGLDLKTVKEDFERWDVMYDLRYKDSIFLKDSVRDTYVPAIIHVYHDEIEKNKQDLDSNKINSKQYTEKLTEIFNRNNDKTLAAVLADLNELKENSFGFEVDSGKTDITTGKVGGDLAWSGDAVWSMNDAEEQGVELYYSIPELGSNVWFDGMCMPKGANVDLAEKFMNFISDPVNAVQNMEYIGYTPGVAGDDVFEYVWETYDVRPLIEAGELEEGTPYKPYDLSYFFASDGEHDDQYVLQANPNAIGRQLTAQYPTKDDLTFLAVMEDFGEREEAVLSMWENVRTNALPTWGIVIFVLEIFGLLALLIVLHLRHRLKNTFRKDRRRRRLA